MTSHVLETVERLCDDVAIINSGRLAWRGEVGHLATAAAWHTMDNEFTTLEGLFLHLVGERGAKLAWL
jgi:ABC-type multidrug transport system ATPase subunit